MLQADIESAGRAFQRALFAAAETKPTYCAELFRGRRAGISAVYEIADG